MRNRSHRTGAPVLGVVAPRARPTLGGATWLASLVALPVYVILTALEWGWRLLSG